MKTVLKTLAVQALIAAVVVGGYFAYDFDVAVHNTIMLGRCVKTIVAPRCKTPETDAYVVSMGRARLASLLFGGNWNANIVFVHEVVAGPEWYRCVYVDPRTGELKKYSTQVQWLELAERYPAPAPPMSGSDMKETLRTGTTVVTDNQDYSDDMELGS